MRVPDAGIYMVGQTVFPTQNPLHRVRVTPLPAAQTPSSAIEVKRTTIALLLTPDSVHISNLLSFFHLGTAVPGTELCSRRSSVLSGVCHSGA